MQALVRDPRENCRKPIIYWDFKMHASEGKVVFIYYLSRLYDIVVTGH